MSQRPDLDIYVTRQTNKLGQVPALRLPAPEEESGVESVWGCEFLEWDASLPVTHAVRRSAVPAWQPGCCCPRSPPLTRSSQWERTQPPTTTQQDMGCVLPGVSWARKHLWHPELARSLLPRLSTLRQPRSTCSSFRLQHTASGSALHHLLHRAASSPPQGFVGVMMR